MDEQGFVVAGSASLALGALSVDVQAATKRKPVATKKHHVKPVAKHHVRHSRHAGSPVALDDAGNPGLRSASALVIDQSSGAVLFEKNANVQVPIASITKLMTAMVVLDAQTGFAKRC